MNRMSKGMAILLAIIMLFSAVPTGVFASSCTTHTPNEDANGNVLWYVTDTNHFKICTVCCEMYENTAHVNDGKDVCSGCGVTLDSGTATHTHNTNGTYGYLDKFGHFLVCSDSTCPGRFETHTNCVKGDQNGDGTWDCDYCTWDGIIVGYGAPCTHGGNNNWYTTSESFHLLQCGDCGANIGTQEAHKDDGSDNLCDICQVGISGGTHTHVWATNWSDNGEGHFHACTDANCSVSNDYGNHEDTNNDTLCDTCQISINNSGNQGGNSCSHNGNNLWYSTMEDGHQRHCGDCGSAVDSEPSKHTDETTVDGKCDVCGVVIDSQNLHTHTWAAAWGKDAKTHWHNCTDTACTTGNLSIAHFDGEDTDTNCDICGEVQNNEWCSGHIEDPSARWEEANGLCYPRCQICRDAYGSGENHVAGDELVGYFDNGVEGHINLCAKCGIEMIDTLKNHTPSENYGCDDFVHSKICLVCENPIPSTEGNHEAGDEWGPLPDGLTHMANCQICHNSIGSMIENHTAPNADSCCEKCHIPVDANGVHNHKLSTTLRAEEREHGYLCESCGMLANTEAHTDNDSNDKCDKCGATVVVIGEADENVLVHNHSTQSNWTKEDCHQHQKFCTDCGAEMERNIHFDEDNDGICDGCNTAMHLDADSNCFCDDCGFDLHIDKDGNGICDTCNTGSKQEEAEQEIAAPLQDELNNAFNSLTSESVETVKSTIQTLVNDNTITEEEAQILNDVIDYVAANPTDEVKVEVVASLKTNNQPIDLNNPSDSVDPEEIDKVADAITAAGASVANFMDITVSRLLEISLLINGETDSETTEAPVSEVPKPIRFYIALDDSNIPEGKSVSSWKVYRIHNGEIDELKVTDEGNGRGYFESDKFSVYALAYDLEDTPSTTTSSSNGSTYYSDLNDFWREVEEDIEKAEKGEIVKEELDDTDKLAWFVIDALRDNPDVGLKITKNGKVVVEIPAGKAIANEAGRAYYSIDDLEDLYAKYLGGDIPAAETPAVAPAEPEVEPEVPEEPSAVVPEEEPEAEEEQKPVEEPTVPEEEPSRGDPKGVVIGLAVAAAIVIIAIFVLLLRKKKV